MAISKNIAGLFASIASDLQLKGRLLTFGRQRLNFNEDFLGALAKNYCLPRVSRHSEQVTDKELFRQFGFEEVVSLDVSDYEGADFVLDLNLAETPSELQSNFDTVFTGGTLEHIFNPGHGLAHALRSLRPGGILIHVAPADRWPDHGFYQLSPELMFSLCHANKLAPLESLLVKIDPKSDAWNVDCVLPGETIHHSESLVRHLHFFAAQKAHDDLEFVSPKQSIYARKHGDDLRRSFFSVRAPFNIQEGVISSSNEEVLVPFEAIETSSATSFNLRLRHVPGFWKASAPARGCAAIVRISETLISNHALSKQAYELASIGHCFRSVGRIRLRWTPDLPDLARKKQVFIVFRSRVSRGH